MRITVGLSKKRMEITQCNTALVIIITGEVTGNSGERFYRNFCLKPLFYECWLWKLFFCAEFRKSFYHITADVII